MKRCPSCEVIKPLDAFRVEKGKPQSYCRDCHKQYMRVYYLRNKERLLAWQAEYKRANPEAAKQRRAALHARNREHDNATSAKWRRNNPDRRAHLQRIHRARKRNAPGQHTPQDVTRLFDLQRGMCPVCRQKLPDAYHVDHVVALSRGGSNDPDNLQLLCPPCNASKHAKDPVSFMQEKGYLL